MDRELEDQIATLISKSMRDLNTRITKVVAKSLNKALKEQAKELKISL
jgi:hypothetical protein